MELHQVDSDIFAILITLPKSNSVNLKNGVFGSDAFLGMWFAKLYLSCWENTWQVQDLIPGRLTDGTYKSPI